MEKKETRPNFNLARQGVPDGRPPWVPVTARKLSPQDIEWPRGCNPASHNAWLEIDENGKAGQSYVWPREDVYRYRRFQARVSSDDPLSDHEIRQLNKLIEQLRSEGLIPEGQTKQPLAKRTSIWSRV